jgi:hypothetical protein
VLIFSLASFSTPRDRRGLLAFGLCAPGRRGVQAPLGGFAQKIRKFGTGFVQIGFLHKNGMERGQRSYFPKL